MQAKAGVVKIRALITGITGFVGSHMAEFLLSKKNEVYGTYRWRSPTENIEHIRDRINLVNCELLDSKSTFEAIKKARPDVIYHLAAQSYVPVSFEEPSHTLQANILGTLNVLEAVRSLNIDPVIHVCSSSEVYGQVRPDEVPIKETNPLRPVSPYGISKAWEDFLGQQYYISYGMKTLITRMFSHTGPRRGDVFVASSFAKQIAEIEKGVEKEHVIHVGNLEIGRA